MKENKNERSLLTQQFWGQNKNLPLGNVLDQTGLQGNKTVKPVLTQTQVKQLEPYGTKVPKYIQERASGWSQLQNLSHDFDLQKIQAAFRSAERGDTTRLFGYYRDFFSNNASVVSALNKRKLAVIADQWTILPRDKKNADDANAARLLKKELENCGEFHDMLIHLMNAILFPIAVIDKTYKDAGDNADSLRYNFNKLSPVAYELLNWQLPYIPQGPLSIGNNSANFTTTPYTQTSTDRPENTIYDPDSWEPSLRFWSVLDSGLVNRSYAYMYVADPNKHIIYRSNLLYGMARENYVGLGKSVLFLAIMAQMGLDIFLRCLQKYGMPIVVAKVDTSQVDTVNQIMDAFGQLNILNAIAINKDAQLEIQEINYSGAADAHVRFLDLINNLITMLILGQTLDSSKSTGGLGTGKKSLQSDVRQDVIAFDRISLSNCLHNQLFKQWLEINGIVGDCYISFGGGNDVETNKTFTDTLVSLNNAGLEPTEESIDHISSQLGFTVQRIGSTETSSVSDNNNDNTENT